MSALDSWLFRLNPNPGLLPEGGKCYQEQTAGAVPQTAGAVPLACPRANPGWRALASKAAFALLSALLSALFSALLFALFSALLFGL